MEDRHETHRAHGIYGVKLMVESKTDENTSGCKNFR